MWSLESFRSDDHIILSAYILIPLTLTAVSLWLSHAAEVSTWLSSAVPLPVSSVPILVGLIVSALVNVMGGYNRTDSSFRMINIGLVDSVFYFSLLPPIIFVSAFALKRKDLVRNSDAVCLLAFVGSVISLLTVAMVLYWCVNSFLDLEISFIELLSFAALISSVDPVSALAVFSKLRVDPNLYNLVLGESLYNDAICVTVFRSASKYIGLSEVSPTLIARTILLEFVVTAILSTMLGYLIGALCSLFFKHCMGEQKNTHDRLVAISILGIMVYLPFLAAEALELSGIVSIVAAAIALRRYCAKNLSTTTRKNASFVFSLLSHTAETASLVLLGLSVFSQTFSNYNWGFIGCSVVALIGGRILLTYPLLLLCNVIRDTRLEKIAPEDEEEKGDPAAEGEEDGALIKRRTMHLVAFSGLLRGAVSFSCAQIFPDTLGSSGLVVSTTTAIILASTFLVGGAIEPLIRHFGIPVHLKKKRRGPFNNSMIVKGGPDWEGKCLYPILVRTTQSQRQKLVAPGPSQQRIYVFTNSDNEDDDDAYSLSHASVIPDMTAELSEDDFEFQDEDYHTPVSASSKAQSDEDHAV